MNFQSFNIAGPLLLTPKVFADERGAFMETFRLNDLTGEYSQDIDFVQENLARSTKAHTLRGLHFQIPPHAQGKLVRCAKGTILDVAVDIRKNSATYGQHIAVELTADTAQSLWVPAGFAHGYLTLADHCEILYKTTAYYAPDHERSLHWADPDLNIHWGIGEADVILSQKDREASSFGDLGHYF